MRVILIIGLISLFCFSGFAQERQVLPVDEAKNDASFYSFREKLITAVKKRDVNFVLSIVDRNIKNGFGGEDGYANFKKQWKITAKNSQLWDVLLKILTNGGAFDSKQKTAFYAPYTFTNFPEDLDAFEYEAVFGNNVNLRSEPNTNSSVVASLSYNVVKVDYKNSIKSGENDYSWLKVETLGGKKGFIKSEFVRSSIDYRAGFEKIKGKWKMTFLLAGD